jgi:hypothetical protein
MDSESLKHREEALRRKDKEVLKREEHVAEQTERLHHMRASMEAQISELEARELVMNDAEVKHGSLLQREELLSRRLREVAEREESLKERLLEVGRRDAEIHEKIKSKQREYDQKLFPLAAREQELFRREQEAKAMEADLDSRLKAFNKRVASEEERDRLKEKSLRELEAKAKDLLALAEKKQQEADQFSQHLTEKQRLVKAEQVEVDSRDREVKWRDEQLRVSLIEHNDVKIKLANWEKSLSSREEELNVALAALELGRSEVGVRDLTVAERLTRLLDAEKDIQERELRAAETIRNAEVMQASAAARAATLQEREQRVAEQSADLAHLSTQLADYERRLNTEEESLQQRRRQQDEKEKAIKQWILELQFREQQIIAAAKKSGSGGGGVGTHQPQAAGGSDLAPATPTTNFSSAIVKMSLDDVQSAYMGAVTKRSQATATRKEHLRRPVDIASLEPDGFDLRLQAAAATVEMEQNLQRMERLFEDSCTRYYCVNDEVKQKIFSPSERSQIAALLRNVAKHADELQFLTSVVLLGGAKAPAAPGKLAHALAAFGEDFSANQWLSYYTVVREAALTRRGSVIAARAGEMQDFVEAVANKAAAYPDELRPRLDRQEVFGVMPACRIRNRDLSKALPLGRPKQAAQKQQPLKQPQTLQKTQDDEKSASPAVCEDHEEDAPEGGPNGADDVALRPMRSPMMLVGAQERERLLAALPSYLRQHYQ